MRRETLEVTEMLDDQYGQMLDLIRKPLEEALGSVPNLSLQELSMLARDTIQTLRWTVDNLKADLLYAEGCLYDKGT